MGEKLNASIIGCGAIHKNHGDFLAKSPLAELLSVVDIDEEKARISSQKYGCRYYTDYREMLGDERIDVVHICTPHYLHAPMAIAAMKSGKHVIVEKPVAISSADALTMIEVSRETGKHIGVCFQNRYNNTSRRIMEVLQSGSIGRVIGAKAIVTWHREEKYYTGSGWRGTWEKEGGGVLINQAIHTIDLLQWFLGDIDRIKGSVNTTLLENVIEVEDTADAVISFKSGVNALLYASNCYGVNSPVFIEIVCENAIIRLEKDVMITYKDGKIETVSDAVEATGEKAYWGKGHPTLLQDFYSRLIEGSGFPVNAEQAITALKMVESIYESSRAKQFVKFY